MENERLGFSGTENPIERITPERARSILLEHELEVSLEEADLILAFLRRFAILTLSELFDK